MRNPTIIVFSIILAVVFLLVSVSNVTSGDYVTYYTFNDTFNTVNYTSYIRNIVGGTNEITGGTYTLTQGNAQSGSWFLNHPLHLNSGYAINLTVNMTYFGAFFSPFGEGRFGFTTDNTTSNPRIYQNFLGLNTAGRIIIVTASGTPIVLYSDINSPNTYQVFNFIFNSTGFFYYRDGACYYSNNNLTIPWSNQDIYFGGGNAGEPPPYNANPTSVIVADIYYEEMVNMLIDNISVQLVTQTAQDVIDTLSFSTYSETPITGIDGLRTVISSGFNITNIVSQTVAFINCGITQLDKIVIYIANTYYIFYETLQTYINVGQKIIIEQTTTFIGIILETIDSISIVIKQVTAFLGEIKTLIVVSGTLGDNDIVHYAMGILPVMLILLIPTLLVREALTEIATIPMFCMMGIVCFLGGILPLWIAILIVLEVVIIYLGEAPDNVNIGR
jgi:hypothetical protein